MKKPGAKASSRTGKPPQRRGKRRTAGGGGAGGKRHGLSPAALSPGAPGAFFLYGRHAVTAALGNMTRPCRRLIARDAAALQDTLVRNRPGLTVDIISDMSVFEATVGPGTPHQGLMLEVQPLPQMDLADGAPSPGGVRGGDTAYPPRLLILDQVTDPQNVGAALRVAAGLGAAALITQDRHSPKESGALARAAAGALDTLPWIRVTNVADSLKTLGDMGYWSVGLTGAADADIDTLDTGRPLAIVMGAEGTGLRPRVAASCDFLARIPMSGRVESLNVSTAAAIALYALRAGDTA
ncbi:TrmH family RNA methyltransferase [Eilatimonas milleporae]|uniref:23S rRNA (Guanosine2251-2'-O)-methyltransferase n=1 Tax=Eilatimonas milleporae TaxID=911205 RepID=A0A3M0C867_9PROT|nr:RNA methyltransferase [Eilatimonas milleporae]RMB04560.1 23S rRNA (guanosine2251-2'-O)-methyltransferase [Eilatimonas milleporae]